MDQGSRNISVVNTLGRIRVSVSKNTSRKIRITLLVLSIGSLAGCANFSGFLAAIEAQFTYRTDPNINIFVLDMDCCRLNPEDSNSISSTIAARFPTGSSSQDLVSYIQNWGGLCTLVGELHECGIEANLYSPTIISLSTVLRARYSVEWRGLDTIEIYERIAYDPTYFGHIDSNQWHHEVALQQQMIQRNLEPSNDPE